MSAHQLIDTTEVVLKLSDIAGLLGTTVLSALMLRKLRGPQ
jgi:hypothetical protein